MNSTFEIVADFYDALQAAGAAPARRCELIPDGKIHRHRVEGDKAGSKNGWHILHLDAPASGAGGSWKSSQRVTWTEKARERMSRAELEILRQRMEQERRQRLAEQEEAFRQGAEFAARLWGQAGQASSLHPYLVRKKIAPGIARQDFGKLLLPVRSFDGALHGVQFIDEWGRKRFSTGTRKQGHFIPSGGFPDGSRPLWIAEGHATASTLQAMRPEVCCIAACDAGNIASVATEARRRWPSLDIVVCPDFDSVGRQKGLEAAKQARARILPPPDVVPENCTDWNDWQALQGVSNVRR